jgi:uncharacterized protein
MSDVMEVEELIRVLQLQPHIEGGYFRETYRASETVLANALPDRYATDRPYGTAIYYLLTANSFSVMHRLKSDEVYHFYLGDTVEMLLLGPDGRSEVRGLGQNLVAGEHVQLTVPRMWWQGLRLRKGGRFGLLGCTVAPGFDYADFEEGTRQALVDKYPLVSELITGLTRR